MSDFAAGASAAYRNAVKYLARVFNIGVTPGLEPKEAFEDAVDRAHELLAEAREGGALNVPDVHGLPQQAPRTTGALRRPPEFEPLGRPAPEAAPFRPIGPRRDGKPRRYGVSFGVFSKDQGEHPIQ